MSNDTWIPTVTETHLVVDGSPLRICLSPEALREMRPEGDRNPVDDLTDSDLAHIASGVLYSDGVWAAIHDALDAEIAHFRQNPRE